MQFKHPEILYTLLLIIIPILVHLFQLQRFIKVPFTNVKILKAIEKQTRKSARLKKWIVLLTRISIFTTLIFAFSQPYFSDYSVQQNFNTVVYLDNSFSMQAKGEQGELLKSIAQEIIENSVNSTHTISVITNDKSFENIDIKRLKNELINIKYHPNKLDLNTVLLKAQSLEINEVNTLNKIILISDFQNINLNKKIDFSTINSSIDLIKLIPKKGNNFYLDSVFIEEKSSTETVIKALLKSTQKSTSNIPVSLHSNEILIGKTTSKFTNSNSATVSFAIPNSQNFNGKISLKDNALEFDNDFYFSISKPDKINVLSIGNYTEFLTRIYTGDEFNFTTVQLQNLNYNELQNQHLIILNEIKEIPTELINNLHTFSTNGGSLALIPSQKSTIDSYTTFFNKFKLGKITAKIENEHKITSINYEHPILKHVFEKKIENFQYPKTRIYYKTDLKGGSSILKLDNNFTFISSVKKENGTIYWIASPLNKDVSDFTQSPLVVPIFYNFAKNSSAISQLYYTISSENNIEIKASIGKDNVLKISNNAMSFGFIPLQTISQNKVTLKLQEHISKSGFYTISNGNIPIKTIAYNYNREESDLNSIHLDSLIANHNNVTIASSVDTIFNKISNQQKINWLFKWFLAFSVLFLLIEMLILKYFNT